MRRWAAASLLVVAALYGRGTGQQAVAAGVAAIIVGSLAAAPRFALSPAAARVVAAASAVAGAVLGWALVPDPGASLRAPWPSFALAGLLAGAALLYRRGGAPSPALSLLPGLAALTACGEAPLGALYGVFAAVHLGLALLALHESDARSEGGQGLSGGLSLAALPRRRAAAFGLLLGLAAALAAGSIFALPPLAFWVQGRILGAIGGAEAGFSDRMWLGSLDGLLQSDEVVMRVEGARADYLRGAVYDHYEEGRWGRLHPGKPAPARLEARPDPGAERVRVTSVAGARDRYFLPLGARDLAAAEPDVTVDRFGVVRVPGRTATEVSFAIGGPAEESCPRARARTTSSCPPPCAAPSCGSPGRGRPAPRRRRPRSTPSRRTFARASRTRSTSSAAAAATRCSTSSSTTTAATASTSPRR